MPTMWDRFDRFRTPMGQRDAAPALNRKKLEEWQNQRSSLKSSQPYGRSYNIKGGPTSARTPARPPRDFDYSNYSSDQSQPTLAVQAPPPASRNYQYRSSQYGRPASSVYSQPSPIAATFAAQQLRNDPNEISPPSSPELYTSNNGHAHEDVSPIEPASTTFHYTMDRQHQVRSHMPQIRREQRQNRGAALNALRESKSREQLRQPRPHTNDVRWDSMTGEPTTTGKGAPSQADPRNEVQKFSKPSSAQQGAPAGPNTSPFSDRVKRVAPPLQTSTGPQAERPEWRGGSGRTTLVAPVIDSTNVAPLNIPRKSSKRANCRGAATGVLSPVSSLDSETTSSPPTQSNVIDSKGPASSTSRAVRNGTQQVQLLAISNSNRGAQSYPSPPLSDDQSVPTKSSRHALSSQRPVKTTLPHSHPPQLELFRNNEKAIRRKPTGGTGHQAEPLCSSSIYSSQLDIHPAQAPPGGFPDDWTQPPSRFSVTTFATSAPTSPRQSIDEDVPPVPTPPRAFTQPSPQPIKSKPEALTGGSILNRKRPVVSGYEDQPRNRTFSEPIKLNMDSPYYVSSSPLPKSASPSGPRTIHGNHSTLSVISTVSTEKDLPRAPPEESARDRVTALNARLEALGNRRININTAIKQMTELMPTDNILASEQVVRKREIEKRKVEILKGELADVRREEYELGLKLHRAYKRMDRDAEFEPTTLWVRRVTG